MYTDNMHALLQSQSFANIMHVHVCTCMNAVKYMQSSTAGAFKVKGSLLWSAYSSLGS